MSVSNGNIVTITATVSGDTATAQTVTDLTQVQANRKSWAPGGPKGLGPGEARPPRPPRPTRRPPPTRLPPEPGRSAVNRLAELGLPGQAVDERGCCGHGNGHPTNRARKS